MVDTIPHDWLLPQTAAGCSTMEVQVQFRHQFELAYRRFRFLLCWAQFTWSTRIAKLGIGSKPIPRAQVTVERLVRSIQFVMSDEETRMKVAKFKEQIQSENGIERAVEIITKHITAARR